MYYLLTLIIFYKDFLYLEKTIKYMYENEKRIKKENGNDSRYYY